MKRYYYTLLLVGILVCAGLSSCKKSFVEIDQKQRIVATKLEHYDLLMNSRKFYTLDEGGLQVAILLGDEVSAAENFLSDNGTIETQRLFRYADLVYDDGKDSYDLKYFLNNLYTCNKVIIEVPTTEDGTAQQKRSLIAEAKATRAWIYLQMINLYAKPYNAISAANDLGFPIIETADIAHQSFTRRTVQEVYDFMLKDLTEAIPDLPLNQKFANRMSKPAAEAILGKTYLFMNKSAEALPYLDAAITDLSKQTKPARLYNYNDEFDANSTGSFLPIDEYGGPNGPGNNPNDYTESLYAVNVYVGEYQPIGIDGLLLSDPAYNLYGANDLRLFFYTDLFSSGDPIPVNPANQQKRVRKYGYNNIKFGLQLPDLYLMRAESRVREGNLSGGLQDLMTLRNNRMPAADATVPSATASNKLALLQFIIDERVREFAAEGYRWFDMRRLHNDPLLGYTLKSHVEYDSEGNVSATHPLREARLTLRLPSPYITANPGMPNNP
ncbi:RagB/SusD family nutrient uptake outer membrane protein [Pedobacter sp. MC2016-14]|uniref:RagB/SusD family nutrient uptake outer membrane protein n=1 Tax=Pedobacter sp. MC2016-14 TaxID=2897327 RepID=UPI001E5F7297|nr:RagB/SusD family nutrient uptake outer membrane protein [Pedobacter sp. MC2016-14]MCD0488642.1 RagB/SusD family nutrient uptake outer membrane protein [Pedobacter sp. MC2016-14]